jgi:hypothetical protein
VVVTIYRPVISQGALSTYQQHKNVLRYYNNDTCPRKQLIDDLAKALLNWKEEGHRIIVAGDFNEDVKGSVISKYFSELQMREIILEQHNGTPSNTYLEGSVPMDGIFATNGIEATFGGFGSFSEGIYSYNRLLWVDIEETILLGTKLVPLWAPKARRLQFRNPKLINNFNMLCQKHHQKVDILNKKIKIEELINANVSTKEWSILLEELDQLRVEGLLQAEKKYRRLKMGKVPW